jgi:hypothetical protein
MRFERSWQKFKDEQGNIIYRPMLFAYLQAVEASQGHHFLVDSGADISMAPLYAFQGLDKAWEEGQEVTLFGISPKKECTVRARIHEVNLIIPDQWLQVRIPVCFAEGNVSFILGREAFFDLFVITFDQERRKTVFESRRL